MSAPIGAATLSARMRRFTAVACPACGVTKRGAADWGGSIGWVGMSTLLPAGVPDGRH